MKTLSKHIYSIMAAASLLLSTAYTQAADYPEPGDATKGAQIWADNCGRCHNIREPKELRDDQWISTMFHMRLRSGLTGQDTRDVLSFMQAANTKSVKLQRKSATTASSSKATPGLTGKDIYTQTCIACHGSDGKGVLPGTPNFTDPKGRLSKSDDELMHSLLNGFQSPGSPMAMPPKGGNSSLTTGDLKNVIQYLRDAFGS